MEDQEALQAEVPYSVPSVSCHFWSQVWIQLVVGVCGLSGCAEQDAVGRQRHWESAETLKAYDVSCAGEIGAGLGNVVASYEPPFPPREGECPLHHPHRRRPLRH